MSCPAQLYDAAIVANGSHAAAWHGWGLLEKRQGNPLRARDLWMKVGSFLLACTASQQLTRSLLVCHQGVRMRLVTATMRLTRRAHNLAAVFVCEQVFVCDRVYVCEQGSSMQGELGCKSWA